VEAPINAPKFVEDLPEHEQEHTGDQGLRLRSERTWGTLAT